MTLTSSLLWRSAIAIGIAAAILGLWLRSEHYAVRARAGDVLLRSAIATGNMNAELARMQEAVSRKVDAVEAVLALRKRDLRRQSDTRRKAIIDAPPSEDGPLAPVLRNQLDRLPRRPAADASGGFAAAGGAGGAAPAQ